MSKRFQTTQWNLVIAAGAAACSETERALGELCRQYWYPLYAFIRKRGYDVQEAEDLTQSFFAMLIEDRHAFTSADPRRGRFRSYLLGTLKHFLADQAVSARAAKRGGGRRIVPLEIRDAEDRLRTEPLHSRSPEWHFDRQWALTVLNLALANLRTLLAREGKERVFENLQPCLGGVSDGLSYRELALVLSMSENAVKVAVHRLRRKYRTCIREEIARTLESVGDVDDEIRHLFEILAS